MIKDILWDEVKNFFSAESMRLAKNYLEDTPWGIGTTRLLSASGAGSALVHGNNDFTADIVLVKGNKQAKVGRAYQANSRMKNIL